MKKDDILNEINKICYCDLEKMGFYPSKKQNIYIKQNGLYKFLIEIKISKGKNQHITLDIEHEEIDKIFKNTIVEAKKRNEQTNIPKGSLSICSLTDWKELYQNLDIGNIWFTGIYDLSEVEKRKNEYIQAFELAKAWFERSNDLNHLYIYNFNEKYTYNIQAALCIGYYLKKNIIEDYNNFKLKNKGIGNWNEKRIDTFIECLLEMNK
jgi:hypothetical protein